MECSQVRVILFENPDMDISPEVREGVEAHLAGCPSCARQFQDLKEQLHALGSLPRMEAPRDFLRQVRGRVDNPSALKAFKDRLGNIFGGNRFFQLAGAAATAAVVILAVQVALKEGPVRTSLPPPHPPALTAPSPEPLKPEGMSPPLVSPTPDVAAPSPESQSPEAMSPPVASPAPSLTAPYPDPYNRASTPPPVASRMPALMPPSPHDMPAPGSMPDSSRMRANIRQKSVAQSMSREARPEPLVSLTLRPGRLGGAGRSPQSAQRGITNDPSGASRSSLGAGRSSPGSNDSRFGSYDSPLEGGGGGVPSYKAKSAPGGGSAVTQTDRAGKSKAKVSAQHEQASLPATQPEARDIVSEVKRLILDADGNIISSAFLPSENKPETLIAEMPAANYPPFLGRLGLLGEVSPGAQENAVPPAGSKVRVKIKFDMRE